jgi:hypothetical protein
VTDFAPRIIRLEQIAAALYGSVLSADGDVAAADLNGACSSMLGQSGFSGYIISQDCREAPRRIADMDGRTIVTDQMATQAFYRFKVHLAPHAARVQTTHQSPTVANITRQVKP